ncbi:Cell wall galactomannoprotein [Moelleriella libera RCEF 2490]|uniref:Cell wall galactomannoprotein n=1 Tax=Moelleriella libera RCEF 2490 TaxID=1081109 RepID=A0A168AS77_9HYPO|nr:Cell wall galactomannoprotein [Moelleriella libera RCEF 2490]
MAALSSATAVLADGKTITDALATIQAKTTDLGAAVSNWRGDLLGALPITFKSTELLTTLKQATRDAEASGVLTLEESLAVASATDELSKTVVSTLQTIVDTKPKFDRLIILSPIVLLNLELEKGATEDFSATVVSKVPQDLKPVAEGLIKPIDDAFAAAIDKYKLF